MDNSVINIFNDIKNKENVNLLPVDNAIADKFKSGFREFSDKLFFKVASNCGGIVIDNWIRLYGSGLINIIDKNNNIIDNFNYDILIGEDVCGGLFALKENVIYYFAPDTLKWESLDVYYSNFLNWVLNNPDGTSQFYKIFRWNGWEDFCKDIELDQGISFYPQLCFESKIEDRSKRIIRIDEIIAMNYELSKQIN